MNDGPATVLMKIGPQHEWQVLERFDTHSEAEDAARRLAKIRPRGVFFPLYATLSADGKGGGGEVF